ncbi:MAG: acetyltransferase [Betaproteobacteria bacterium]|nr:MAG: acetyltransferase [Betaproteobacteria bacterium]
MKSQAFIVGTGGHARVVGAALRLLGIEIVGLVDLEPAAGKEVICGAPVLGGLDELSRLAVEQHDAYVAVGDNSKRKTLVGELHTAGYRLPALIHPHSCLDHRVRVGEASCVCIGASVATEVRIGRGVIVNTGTLVDHESDIGEFVHLAPGVIIAGRVSVGEGAFIGMGARVADRLSIGREAIIGAGSVILKDVPDGAKVIGVHH